jgi:hypothetical protein
MVFLGTVTEALAIQDGRVVRARMRIDRAYKGVSEPALILFDDGMCDGPDLQVGEQYLMYTRRIEEGDVPARGCTRSRLAKFAEEDLKYLESLNEAAPIARVFGQVASWPEGPGGKLPLPGAVVQLQGPEGTLRATADDKGFYSFDGLKAGKYSVSADQSGFRMPSLKSGMFSDSVEARGCAAIDVTLRKDWPGAIAGSLVRPDNTPAAAGIDLMLIRIDGDGESALSTSLFGDEVRTGDRGEYSFRGVAPGRYKVVLHWCCFPTPEAPYPAIYWPAASTQTDAAEIVIGNAVVPRRYDFHLPPEVKSMVVSGLVLLPDGKPAEGARVQIWLLPDNAVTGNDATTDAAGYFSFTAMGGLEYSLTAIGRGEHPLTSEALHYSRNSGPHFITLLLDSPGPFDNPR